MSNLNLRTITQIRETAKATGDFITWIKCNKEFTRRGLYIADAIKYGK